MINVFCKCIQHSTHLCVLRYRYLDYLPIYYEACKGASPTGSAVDVFVATFISFPVGVLAGAMVNKSGVYRPQLWFAWMAMIAGIAVFSTYGVNTSRSVSILRQLPFSLGFGVIMTVCFFPVLAPIPVDLHANAMALLMFIRFFSQVSDSECNYFMF